MLNNGFAGTVLFIDLTAGKTFKEDTKREYAEDYLGGLGMNLKLAADYMNVDAGASAPENRIILGAGPLVGTSIPSTSRIFSVSKLPSSNAIGWSGAGGVNLGYQLKSAGYDHVVIEGKADRPVFITIENENVTLHDAENLRGKGVEETCNLLWERYRLPSGILSIGQAGENQVSFSMAFIDRIATLGRGGLGAVMGSKNLKAIVVRGSKGIRIADRRRYRILHQELSDEIRQYPYLKEWQEKGMIKAFPVVDEKTYDKIKKRRIACISCPVGCKDVIRIPDGRFKGTLAYTSSIINLFTPVIYGLKDHGESIRLMKALDDFGLDSFEFFGIMQFTKRLVEKGIIPSERVEHNIDETCLDSMLYWAESIALRRGLGRILAGGFDEIINQFSRESEALAPALIKGIHPYAGPKSALPWNLFGTMELGQLLDPRGPHVGSGGSPTYFARRPAEAFQKHFRRMGIPESAVSRILKTEGSETFQLNVGRLLKYSHCWFAILGSLGICARGQINRFYNAHRCAEFYEAVTGIQSDPNQLMSKAENVWKLYLKLNDRDDASEVEQYHIPEQWIGDGGFREYVTENPLSEEEIRQMIQEYYNEWGLA